MTQAVPYEYSSGFKFLSLPIHFLKDGELSCEDKIILAEIYSLQKDAGCFASNAHFGGLTNLKERSVRRHLTDLEERGYLYAENRDSLRRRLWISDELRQTVESGPKPALSAAASKEPSEVKDTDPQVHATRPCVTGQPGHSEKHPVAADLDTRPPATAEKSMREQEEKSKEENNRDVGFSLPNWLPASDWNEWVTYNAEAGRRLTPTQIQKHIEALDALDRKGQRPNAVIGYAIQNGWKAPYELPESMRPKSFRTRTGAYYMEGIGYVR
jgi:hypothetical protein